MPISIRYQNDPNQECVIRPAPLVSIAQNINNNKMGRLGASYNITLTGTLLVSEGFPLARDTRTDTLFDYVIGSTSEPAVADAGPYKSFYTGQSHNFQTDMFDNKPKTQLIPYEAAVDAMFFKQKVLRALFARDGQRMEISPIHTDEPAVICFPRLIDINFDEGIYVDKCNYTIQLQADILYDNDLMVDADGNPSLKENQTFGEIINDGSRFVESFSDTWSLEVDDNLQETPELARSYRISRNISAVGKDVYGPTDLSVDGNISDNKIPAWRHARDFVLSKRGNPEDSYPNMMGTIGSGLINLVDTYRGYNHVVTENISEDAGSYSVSENWLIASGSAYETYNMSISRSIDNPFVNVSINGEVTGLSTYSPSGVIFGGTDASGKTAYQNALERFYDVSSSGQFKISSNIFKRANNAVAVELNSQPKNISLGVNESAGTITYNIDYDNRPMNVVSGVLTENISINDSYPGDVFATIPIPGRETGPILQAIGGRTEYRRDLSLDLILDYSQLPYSASRNPLMLKKPTLVEPMRGQILYLINQVSPHREPGIRKWFVGPPSEGWTPKEGRYTLSVSWTYELNE